MKKSTKQLLNKIILLILLMVCVVGIVSVQADEGEVVIYSAMETFRNDDLKEQLKEKFPDLDVVIQYISTNKGAAKLKLEKKQTDADIIIAFDIQSLELIKDGLADLSEYDVAHYMEGLNPEHNKYRIWEKFAGAIVVNMDVIEKLNLPVPNSYEDLLNPVYKELISMPDPKSSGTGYFFLKNRVNEIGEDEAFEYFKELYPNIKQFTESGSGPIKLLLQEEVAVGLGMTFQAVGEINKGANLKIIYPEEGSPYSLAGVAMIEGKQHREEVKQVFEFLYDEFIFHDKAYYSPELIFKEQEVKVENYPQNIQYANMEGLSSAEEKQRLLRKWEY